MGSGRSNSARRLAFALAWPLVAIGCGSDGGGDRAEDGIADATGDGEDGGDDTGAGDDTGTDPGGGGGTDDGGTNDDPMTPDSPLVDPDCIDGMFAETLPDAMADISDLEDGFASSAPDDFVLDVLLRRYTTGHEVSVRGSDGGFDCVDAFLRPAADPGEIYSQLPTIVHECGHGTDFNLGGFDEDVYFVNDSPLELRCTAGDSTDRGGRTFARSRIRDDEYQALNEYDSYAGIYLDGDPDDGNFDGGDQGFNSVLEETLQYVNSIATAYAFHEELDTGGWVSHKDGILTFLWYLMRYLRMARLDYPDAHDYLQNGESGCWRRAILTIWGRAWLYLVATEDMDHLGINDELLLELVGEPELLGEIQRLRDAEGCPPPGAVDR